MDSVQHNANTMNQQLSQNIKPVVLKVWSTRLFFVSQMYIWQEENNTGFL
jgi:hypothetical protein